MDASEDWALVGVTPEEIEANAVAVLRRYRSAYVKNILLTQLLTSRLPIDEIMFGLSLSLASEHQ